MFVSVNIFYDDVHLLCQASDSNCCSSSTWLCSGPAAFLCSHFAMVVFNFFLVNSVIIIVVSSSIFRSILVELLGQNIGSTFLRS